MLKQPQILIEFSKSDIKQFDSIINKEIQSKTAPYYIITVNENFEIEEILDFLKNELNYLNNKKRNIELKLSLGFKNKSNNFLEFFIYEIFKDNFEFLENDKNLIISKIKNINEKYLQNQVFFDKKIEEKYEDNVVEIPSNKLIYIYDLYNFIMRVISVGGESFSEENNLRNKAIKSLYNNLKSVEQDQNPDMIFFADEDSQYSKRKEFYPEYKKNRKEKPKEQLEEIENTKDFLKGCGFKIISQKGLEGDDVISTYAKELSKDKTNKIIIFSSDKDLYCNISDNVFVYDPLKEKFINKKRCFERFGIYPEQMVDYLSLVGDTSDNIKGCPKVGKVATVKLLQKYKNIENIYKSLTQIEKEEGASLAKNLREGEESVKISYELVRTHSFKINDNINDFKFKNWKEIGKDIFKKYGILKKQNLKP